MDIHHIFLFAVAAPDDHISIQEKSFFQAAAAAEKDHLCLKIKLGDSRAAVLIFLVILFRIPRSILTVFLFCARFRISGFLQRVLLLIILLFRLFFQSKTSEYRIVIIKDNGILLALIHGYAFLDGNIALHGTVPVQMIRGDI